MKVIPLQADGKTPLHDGWTLDAAHREGVFGRAGDAAFRVDDPTVSPHHALFSWQGGTLVVRDLDSINGLVRGGRKVRRTEFASEETVAAGNVFLRVVPDAADAAARFRARLLQGAVVLAAIAVLLLAAKVASEYTLERHASDGAAEEVLVPVNPAPPTPAQQAEFARIERSRRLMDEAVDGLSNGEPPELAAEKLVEAIRLYDDPAGRAKAFLTGMQARYAVPHLAAAEEAAKNRDYAKVEEEVAAAKIYYAEPPEEMKRIRELVASERAYEEALRLAETGKIDEAAAKAETIDSALVPEAADLRERIDFSRRAEAWLDGFAAAVGRGDIKAAEKSLEAEDEWADWLSEPAEDRLAAAKKDLAHVERLVEMYLAGHVHDLLVFDPSDHGFPVLQEAAESLAERCRPRAEADRALLAEAERTAGDLSREPETEEEARASLVAEMPAARLYWGSGRTDGAKERFFLHHGRWLAYVHRVLDRTHAFLALGARDQARETLGAILPDISEGMPGAGEVLSLADELGVELPSGGR